MTWRVLVVDDDPQIRHSIADVLRDEGYIVDLAANGHEAVASIESTPPNVIITDLLMPGMNGKQLVERLQAAQKTADIPILLMTALHGLESKLSANSQNILEKPLQVDQLLNKIALACFRGRGTR